MTRGAALFLVGSVTLLALAGCGRGFMSFEQRAAWRGEAEAACMRSGAVQAGERLERLRPISGPGTCGANQPLRVAALGDRSILGYMQELRPPAAIGDQFPIREPRRPAAPPATNSGAWNGSSGGAGRTHGGYYDAQASRGPVSLHPPGVPRDADAEASEEWAEEETEPAPRARNARRGGAFDDPYAAPPRSRRDAPPVQRRGAAPPSPPPQSPLPALGPQRGAPLSVGSAVVRPAATLACPLVARLDQWMVATVQPAAQRWLGQPVTEIRQISAYSCRGMNGQAGAPISEHAFGNALDISAFVLADGRRITVQHGWRGSPEEQGFLRDVHAGACEIFSTVLAPGSNRFHFDHIHVDLARRQSGRRVCNPAAIPGELVARRAIGRGGRMGFAAEEQGAGRGLTVQLPRAIPGAD